MASLLDNGRANNSGAGINLALLRANTPQYEQAMAVVLAERGADGAGVEAAPAITGLQFNYLKDVGAAIQR